MPALTAPLAEACEQAVGATPLIIDARSPLPITLDVEEPLTVGADRIINTLAASRIYRRDTIVVDLGTATTYDCITADGVFLGGVIAPGVRTSAETLFRRTSKLPATEIAPPARVIGRRTEECIRSGVVLGGAEAIDGLVRRIKGEWPRRGGPAGGRDRRPGGGVRAVLPGVRDHRTVSDADRAPHGARAGVRSIVSDVARSRQRRAAAMAHVRHRPSDRVRAAARRRLQLHPAPSAARVADHGRAHVDRVHHRDRRSRVPEGRHVGVYLIMLLSWVGCLNAGTLALNSAFDRDEGDIGYLDAPPPIPKHLALVSVALMAVGQAARASHCGPGSPIAYAICFAMSLAYSVPPVRLKAVAGADWVINIIGVGVLTPFAGWSASGFALRPEGRWIMIGFGCLFGALYPLTQIYQFDEDSYARRSDACAHPRR